EPFDFRPGGKSADPARLEACDDVGCRAQGFREYRDGYAAQQTHVAEDLAEHGIHMGRTFVDREQSNAWTALSRPLPGQRRR
ncbi:MAG TPA: hypothetical protein VFV47_14570, partial [Hyphomicrobiaceae bacterium]|nr:hypothetical protein [Hyphomicrobiaceae bacterium]